MQKYRTDKTWEWNLQNAPAPVQVDAVPSLNGRWNWCGIPVRSPMGISAGPLLNSGWILQYAAAGFDILVYKTVRSVARACYDLPNLVPVEVSSLEEAGSIVPEKSEMSGSWAVSFGMPSVTPEAWQKDIQRTKSMLASGQVLVVSVVATAAPSLEGEAALEQLADDFADCARLAMDAGADGIEANFSCPNVDTADGQLYQHPRSAARVTERIRNAISTAPLVLKIGRVETRQAAESLVLATSQFINGMAMTNSISAHVRCENGQLLFDGQQRGICGDATRLTSISQLKLFRDVCQDLIKSGRLTADMQPQLIGVGGISTAEHVNDYLAAGADSVALATAAMVNPRVGLEIRESLSGNPPHRFHETGVRRGVTG